MNNDQRAILLAEQEQQALDELCREDLGLFAEQCFGFDNGQHHEEWYGLLDNRAYQTGMGDKASVQFILPDQKPVNNDWIMLEAPRDHAKSTTHSVVYPTYEIGKNPNVRVVIASNGQSTAEGFLGQISNVIEKSENYHRIMGRLKPQRPTEWNKESITVERSDYMLKDPTVSATSIGGQVVSRRADIIICDDILNLANTRTENQRQFVKTWFWTVLFPVLVPGGRLIVVGTAWNKQDLYQELLQLPDFKVKMRYDALINEDRKEVLWPERYDWTELMKRRRAMGTLAFNRSYRNLTANPEDSPFKEPWLQKAIRKGQNRTLIRALDYSRWDLGGMTITIGVDPAISKKKGSDFFALAVVGRTADGRKIPLYALRRKLTPGEQRSTIMNVAARFNPDLIVVESNAYQASLQMDLADQTDLPIVAYQTGGEKYDEEVGLNSLAVEFENGVWIIPYDSQDIYTVTQMDFLLNGMRNYDPSGDDHTEDLLMALWLANGGQRQLRADVADTGMSMSGSRR